MKGLLRGLRSPLLHFFLMGALLLGLKNLYQEFPQKPPAAKPAEELLVSTDQVEQLKKELTRRNGLLPSKVQVHEAVENFIDEEILYRQARSLGLDRNNPTIRYRLVQLARFVSEDPGQNEESLYRQALKLGFAQGDLVIRREMATLMRILLEKIPTKQAPATLSQADLEEYYVRNADKFLSQQKLSFFHVYFSRDQRGARARQDAERLLKKVETQKMNPLEAVALGDPFLGGQEIRQNSPRMIQRTFGPQFAKALSKLDKETWSGPVASSYGWHLVWLSQREAPQTLELEKVRNQVRYGLIRERREHRFRDALAKLRSNYVIKVNDDG